jgi:hypothetical protein
VIKVVIDYDLLTEGQNETIIKELSVAADSIIRTFHFERPYGIQFHGSAETGLNLDDGHIPYRQLRRS